VPATWRNKVDEALQRYPSEEIAEASGKAYDGCYYNNFTFE
jgi:hypothetical protein